MGHYGVEQKILWQAQRRDMGRGQLRQEKRGRGQERCRGGRNDQYGGRLIMSQGANGGC